MHIGLARAARHHRGLAAGRLDEVAHRVAAIVPTQVAHEFDFAARTDAAAQRQRHGHANHPSAAAQRDQFGDIGAGSDAAEIKQVQRPFLLQPAQNRHRVANRRKIRLRAKLGPRRADAGAAIEQQEIHAVVERERHRVLQRRPRDDETEQLIGARPRHLYRPEMMAHRVSHARGRRIGFDQVRRDQLHPRH